MLRIHGKDLAGNDVAKQYMCDLCGFQSHYITNYKAHMVKHTGERPHKCPVCDFATNDRSTLKIHMRGHTGETPYACVQCDKAYTSQSALARHHRSHTGYRPHKCLDCGAAYHDKKNLLAHSYKHTGVKPFKCMLCAFACVKKFNLDSHIRQQHGAEHLPEDGRKMNGKKHKPVRCVGGEQRDAVNEEKVGSVEQLHIEQQLTSLAHYPQIQGVDGKIDQETAAAAVVMQNMAAGTLSKSVYEPPSLLPQHMQYPLMHNVSPMSNNQLVKYDVAVTTTPEHGLNTLTELNAYPPQQTLHPQQQLVEHTASVVMATPESSSVAMPMACQQTMAEEGRSRQEDEHLVAGGDAGLDLSIQDTYNTAGGSSSSSSVSASHHAAMMALRLYQQ